MNSKVRCSPSLLSSNTSDQIQYSAVSSLQIDDMFCSILSQMVSVWVKYWAFTYVYHCAAINSPPLVLKNENKCLRASYTLKHEGSTQAPCDVDEAHKPRPRCVKTWAWHKRRQWLALRLLEREHWQTWTLCADISRGFVEP